MEVVSVSYRLCTYEKNYRPTICDTDLCHYGSNKIGCKTKNKTLYAMSLAHVITPPSFSKKSLYIYFHAVMNDS